MTEYEWLTCEKLTAIFAYMENSDETLQFGWFIWHRSMVTGRGSLVWKQPDAVSPSTIYDITERHACDLVREFVGNPFRPVVRRNHRQLAMTGDVYYFAANIIESGDYGSVDVLADMLEEVGCDNEEILHHLRGEVKCLECHKYGISPVNGCQGWIPKPVPCQPGCWVLRLLTETGTPVEA